MSKTWYPVINYEKCIQCGVCVERCKNKVYDKEKAPRPVVLYPEGCIQGCKGCGNLCPTGAINYVGEKVSNSDDCGCGCECTDDKRGCC